jgi:hypothetical protein
MIRLFVGFDPREAVAYHTFCQSVIARCSMPVAFTPLALNNLAGGYVEGHTDGSNEFIYSRFLVPYLCNFQGYAIFADGDMLCLEDLAQLWDMRDPNKAVQVVKHDYLTCERTKYLRAKNEDYPRKNWSSVIIWNCGHPDNACLTPEYVAASTGPHLHRFAWLDDSVVGDLPVDWNWLAIEYPELKRHMPKLVHYTLGAPCFEGYHDRDFAEVWYKELRQMLSVPDGVHDKLAWLKHL